MSLLNFPSQLQKTSMNMGFADWMGSEYILCKYLVFLTIIMQDCWLKQIGLEFCRFREKVSGRGFLKINIFQKGDDGFDKSKNDFELAGMCS